VHAVDALEPTIQKQIISSYPTDTVASQHITDPQHLWSCSKDGLLLYKGLIHIPESPPSLHLEILRDHYDAPLLGHHGITKTIELITRNYWFPGINAVTKDYINSCQSCQQGKAPWYLHHGELIPLPVPDAPWKELSCDFITDLPVSNGMDFILVFVDRMTKMSHFIPCLKSTTAFEFAQLFVSHIVRLYGLSDSIVSNRSSIFTSNFCSILTSILKIDLRKSTVFHPQTYD